MAEHEIAPCHRHRGRRGQVLTGAVVLGRQHPRVLSGEVAVRVPPVEEVVLDPNPQVLALPGRVARVAVNDPGRGAVDRNYGPGVHVVQERGPRSEEQTSELQSLMRITYAVFCLKKKRQE